MAIAYTSLTSASSTTDASSYASDSISPGTNVLVLAAFASIMTSSTTPNAATATGCGLTWVEVTSLAYDTAGTQRGRLTVLRAMGSPTSGAVTFDLAGQTQVEAGWSIIQFSGTSTSGTDGSGAIVQSATNTGTGTGASATLGAFQSAENATYGAFSCGDTGVAPFFAPGSGFTEAHDVGDLNLATATEYVLANDTSVDGTWASSPTEGWGAIALEIGAPVTWATVAWLTA